MRPTEPGSSHTSSSRNSTYRATDRSSRNARCWARPRRGRLPQSSTGCPRWRRIRTSPATALFSHAGAPSDWSLTTTPNRSSCAASPLSVAASSAGRLRVGTSTSRRRGRWNASARPGSSGRYMTVRYPGYSPAMRYRELLDEARAAGVPEPADDAGARLDRSHFLYRVAERGGCAPDEAPDRVRRVLHAVAHGLPDGVMVDVATAIPADLLDLLPPVPGPGRSAAT